MRPRALRCPLAKGKEFRKDVPQHRTEHNDVVVRFDHRRMDGTWPLREQVR